MAIEDDVAANMTAIAALQISVASAYSGLIASHSLGLVSCYSSLAALDADGTAFALKDTAIGAILYDMSHHTNTANP